MASFVWAAASAGNWSVGGNWKVGGVAQSSPPTAADDVTLGTGTGFTQSNCTIDATSVCRSLDCTSYTGTLACNAQLTLGTTTSIGSAISLKLVSGMGFTISAGSFIFASTSGTQETVDSGTKAMPNMQFTGVGGSWILSNGWSNSTTGIVHNNGTLDLNGKTITLFSYSSSSGLARTLTMGGANVICAGATANGTNWSVTAASMTLNANTSTITLTTPSGIFAGGGLTYNSVVLSGSGTQQITGTNTFANLTRTGTAVVGDAWSVNAGITVTGTLTIGGNTTQGINRLWMVSSLIGTQRTISASGAAVVINGDVDFEDITITGSPSWTNGGSAYVGDALGNGSLITTNRTTPATQTYTGSGNWSIAGNWTSRTPLPQDSVVLNAGTTGNVTRNMPRLGADIDASLFTHLIANSIASTMFGNLTLGASAAISSGTVTLAGRGNQTITMNGGSATTSNFTINGGPSSSGTPSNYVLQDNFLTTGTVNITSGTLDANGHNVTVSNVTTTAGSTKAVALGANSVWTVTSTGTIWNFSGTITTSGSSTIVIADTSITSKTFTGGAQTYDNLTITGGNGTPVVITGANTFKNVTVTNPDTVLTWPSSVTNTVATFSGTGTNYGYVYLPGQTNHYPNAPSSSALNFTGDFTLEINVALVNWASGSANGLIGKWTGTAATSQYWLFLNASNKLVLQTSDGAATASAVCSVVTGFTAGSRQWIRVTRRSSDGRVQFWWSTNYSSWTQLGTDQTATVGAITTSTQLLAMGQNSAGGNPMIGSLYEVKLWNDITQSSLVFDANFTTKAFGANTFTESSSNAATVTITGSQAQAGDGRILVNASTGGTKATLSSTGLVACDYLYVLDNTAAGNTPFYAGANGVLSNTTNWSAIAAPSGNFLLVM